METRTKKNRKKSDETNKFTMNTRKNENKSEESVIGEKEKKSDKYIHINKIPNDVRKNV